jgi:hypothetical protein
VEKLKRFTFLVVGLNQQRFDHAEDRFHGFPVEVPPFANGEEGVTGALMPQLQGLSPVVFPEHVQHTLGLHEKLAWPLHEDFLHSAHSAHFIVPARLLGLQGLLLLFPCRLFEVVEEAVLAALHFLLGWNFVAVQHDQHEVLNVLEALQAEVVKKGADYVAASPHEHNAIADQLVIKFEPLLL